MKKQTMAAEKMTLEDRAYELCSYRLNHGPGHGRFDSTCDSCDTALEALQCVRDEARADARDERSQECMAAIEHGGLVAIFADPTDSKDPLLNLLGQIAMYVLELEERVNREASDDE